MHLPCTVLKMVYRDGKIWGIVSVRLIHLPERPRELMRLADEDMDQTMSLPARLVNGDWDVEVPDGTGRVRRLVWELDSE